MCNVKDSILLGSKLFINVLDLSRKSWERNYPSLCMKVFTITSALDECNLKAYQNI